MATKNKAPGAINKGIQGQNSGTVNFLRFDKTGRIYFIGNQKKTKGTFNYQ